MCGRFVSAAPTDEVARYFSVPSEPETVLEPSWNVAPTADVYVVVSSDQGRRLDAFHWGLVPFWAKDPKVGNRMINARAESLATSGAFKHAFRRRRCVIPADGFYEWTLLPDRKRKQPYFIHRPDDEPYGFAGLWEEWRRPESDDVLRSCTIITTSANEVVGNLHDRMPVILPPPAFERWLDPGFDRVDDLRELLVPAPPEMTALHPVSVEVGNVRNDDPSLTEPVEVDVAAGSGGGMPATGGQGTLL